MRWLTGGAQDSEYQGKLDARDGPGAKGFAAARSGMDTRGIHRFIQGTHIAIPVLVPPR